MRYLQIAEVFDKMELTTKRLELTDLLAGLLRNTPKSEIQKVVYLLQGKLCPDYLGVELGVAEKLALKAVAISAGIEPHRAQEVFDSTGDIGKTAEALLATRIQATLFSEPLVVNRVYEVLEKIAATQGSGSVGLKNRYLASLLNDAAPNEAKHIIRAVTGKLRLGIADYTVLDALAIAYTGDRSNRKILERAYNISGDLGAIAAVVVEKGLPGLLKLRVQVGRPIRPMLAERIETAEQALEKSGRECAVEFKLDGERLQIHKDGSSVTLFSRRLENVTSHYPDVLELVVHHVKAEKSILEAEAVPIDLDSGEYLPFQEIMHRRRKHGIAQAVDDYPIRLNIFDVLYVDGEDFTIVPHRNRRDTLNTLVESDERIQTVPAIVATSAKEIEDFMEQAVDAGCEGVVVKDLESPYRAGAREFAWIKLKREYQTQLTDTLDLIIVGAFHGRGRRAGKYGAFLLACLDESENIYRTVCKIGTGFTDEHLAEFPKLLRPSVLYKKHPMVDSKMDANVWLEPKLVIEIGASEVTLSPIHTAGYGSVRAGSGLALRFPKYMGKIRTDKTPKDATTVTELVAMYAAQSKRVQPTKGKFIDDAKTKRDDISRNYGSAL